MRIESNLAKVSAQLETLIKRVPEAIDRASSPKVWEKPAREMAQRVLLAVALPHERMFIPRFVETITATVLGNSEGFSLQMTRPMMQDATTLQGAQAARAATGAAELSTGLFSLPIQQFEDLIEQWVGTAEAEGGKARDARDLGKTDEEIAHLISYIMLSPQAGEKALAARARLAPHIQKFLIQAQPQLPAETNNLWMKMVLEAWRELVRFDFPLIFRRELRAKA
jgi:hypothetical protein